LGKNWELGVRYRFLGAAPFTPFNETASLANYSTLGRGILDYSQINTQRTGSFSSLDMRIDKKWNFSRWALNVFLDIQNVLNIKNLTPPTFTLKRNPDNSFATSDGNAYNGQNGVPVYLENTSGARLPTIGMNIEF